MGLLDIRGISICLGLLCPLPVFAQDSTGTVDGAAYENVRLGLLLPDFRSVDFKAVRAATEIWVRELGKALGYELETSLYTDWSQMEQDALHNKIDIMSASPVKYFYLKEEMDVEVVFTTRRANKITRKIYLLVRADSTYQDIADLTHRTVAVQQGDEIGVLYLNTLLLRNGLSESDMFFSAVEPKEKHSSAIMAVFFGQADACISYDVIFDTMSELNPQIGTQLRVLRASKELINIIAFVRKDVAPDFADQVKQGIMRVDDTPVGRQIMTLFQIDGLQTIDESELGNIESLMREYKTLAGER